ncbi:MAG TPA: MarR family transcriptional regulator [Thermoanaerobaculia bacterium]|nr:MarR family transcriptional regulator [Thermoanaerobaculia bacterium]
MPPRPASASGVPEELASRLHSAAIRLLRHLRRVDVESGLSGPKLSALSVVVFAGPLSLGGLAGAEQVRPPTMTRLVRDLKAQGLVRTTPDPHDRRAIRIEATARGRRLLEQGRRRRLAALASLIERQSKTERRALGDALRQIESVLRELTGLRHPSGGPSTRRKN